MREINPQATTRAYAFEMWMQALNPMVTFFKNLDVTNLIRYAKEKGGSTFHAILWAAVKAANSVPELRQRIVGGKIVEYEHCNAGYTVALEDHTFCNCYTESRMSLDAFFVDAAKRQEEAKKHPGFVNPDEEETGLIFTSCIPWLSFTQVIQPAPIPADCNPRIVFGKYIPEGERTLMPLHIQCNHALVDGFHVAEFYREFQQINDSL